jgi:membrane protease YdiL (CAAX protease family)
LKKSDSIFLISLLFVFCLPFLTIFRAKAGYLAPQIIEDFVQQGVGFWLGLVLMIILLSLISYLLMNKISYLKNLEQEYGLRKASDDIFILFWILGWVIYILPLQFRDPSDLMVVYGQFYLQFGILGLAYVILIKINHFYQAMQMEKAEREKAEMFEFGSKVRFVEIILISVLVFCLVLLSSYLIPSNLSEGILTEDGRDYLLFNVFYSVPAEEIIFRGLVFDLIFLFSFRILLYCGKIPQEYRNHKIIDAQIQNQHKKEEMHKKLSKFENWAFLIAIGISSLSFVIYHIPRYGFDLWVLLYILILGFALGFAKRYYGLLSAFLIHLLNNLVANSSAII